jgi:agmatine deiminase
VNGEVPGDDTDGHVDCFARFAPDRVVLALDPHPEMSPSLPLLAANAARLRKWTEERNWRFLPLPIPGPVVEDGMVLPATYANFYVANRAVLLPSFNDSRDGEAASIVAEAFPGREVIPFPAKELIIGQGGIHCLTQPLPA